MSDDPDAKPDLMTNFLHISVPDLTRFQRSAPEVGCAPGVDTCGKLIKADKDATRAGHVFLTHMAQGITKLRDVVARSSQAYVDGAAYTEATIRGALDYDERTMLPDVAPVLATPQPKS